MNPIVERIGKELTCIPSQIITAGAANKNANGRYFFGLLTNGMIFPITQYAMIEIAIMTIEKTCNRTLSVIMERLI